MNAILKFPLGSGIQVCARRLSILFQIFNVITLIWQLWRDLVLKNGLTQSSVKTNKNFKILFHKFQVQYGGKIYQKFGQ